MQHTVGTLSCKLVKVGLFLLFTFFQSVNDKKVPKSVSPGRKLRTNGAKREHAQDAVIYELPTDRRSRFTAKKPRTSTFFRISAHPDFP